MEANTKDTYIDLKEDTEGGALVLYLHIIIVGRERKTYLVCRLRTNQRRIPHQVPTSCLDVEITDKQQLTLAC